MFEFFSFSISALKQREIGLNKGGIGPLGDKRAQKGHGIANATASRLLEDRDHGRLPDLVLMIVFSLACQGTSQPFRGAPWVDPKRGGTQSFCLAPSVFSYLLRRPLGFWFKRGGDKGLPRNSLYTSFLMKH